MGYTVREAVTAVALAGFVTVTLGAVLSAGGNLIQSARQNLRASQVLMEKAEALRLFAGSQVSDTNSYRQPLFVEPHDPRGAGFEASRVQYAGYLSGTGLADTTRPNLRPVTLTLCWTNSEGAKPVVHTRAVQARLARNGTPKYIWGAL